MTAKISRHGVTAVKYLHELPAVGLFERNIAVPVPDPVGAHMPEDAGLLNGVVEIL